MSRENSNFSDAPPIEAGQQVAYLRQVLGQAEEVAASGCGGSNDAALDEAARISVAYQHSLPVMRKRFDALAEETIAWAAVAVEALRRARETGGPPRAAAAQLVRELDAALRALRRTLQLR